MAENSKLAEIYEKRFESNMARALRNTRLQTDGSKVARVKEISEDLVKRLFKREICAIHIPGYCDSKLAAKAACLVLKDSKVTSWYLGKGRSRVKTDMSYSIGIPVQHTAISKQALKKYQKESLHWIRKVRDVFAPELSPLDRLRLELDEVWPYGANVSPFLKKKGFVGLFRVMRPEDLYPGIAGKMGICHIDESIQNMQFSSNIYLDVPQKGGELSIWNTSLNSHTSRSQLYKLLDYAFDPEIQEIIHDRLGKPFIIKPRPGDLVILDSSRPHAVAGFSRGTRISIQSFLAPLRNKDKSFPKGGLSNILMYS